MFEKPEDTRVAKLVGAWLLLFWLGFGFGFLLGWLVGG